MLGDVLRRREVATVDRDLHLSPTLRQRRFMLFCIACSSVCSPSPVFYGFLSCQRNTTEHTKHMVANRTLKNLTNFNWRINLLHKCYTDNTVVHTIKAHVIIVLNFSVSLTINSQTEIVTFYLYLVVCRGHNRFYSFPYMSVCRLSRLLSFQLLIMYRWHRPIRVRLFLRDQHNITMNEWSNQ